MVERPGLEVECRLDHAYLTQRAAAGDGIRPLEGRDGLRPDLCPRTALRHELGGKQHSCKPQRGESPGAACRQADSATAARTGANAFRR
jgi:hypothetical protein